MIKRVIFDIDYTLLEPNYSKIPVFLKNYSNNYYFVNNLRSILTDYEKKHKKYIISDLLEHLNQYTEKQLDEIFLEELFNFNKNLKEQDMSETYDILEYLYPKYELVILSNWFKEVQITKLEKMNILKYFKEIYTGDDYLKPYPKSYKLAIGKNKAEECIMIGDSLEEDVIGPINNGLNAVHYTRGEDKKHNYQKVKTLNELKKIL